MSPLSRVRGVHGPPPPPLCKDKALVGDALLFVWYYVGELSLVLGYFLQWEGFFGWQKMGKDLVGETIMLLCLF